MLYPPPTKTNLKRPEPDWQFVHTELKRRGVTLQTLWIEYKTQNPDGYQYSRFCDLYKAWRGTVEVVMHQTYRAGEKMFVDYAGMSVDVIERSTGEVKKAQVFVAVLGASNYTYAEATWTQSLEDWIGSHCRAFEYFGGVTEILVPDNTKAGVSHASYYEPDLNPTYQEMATYYSTAVVPARPRHPRDRAKVESAVQVVERLILAHLRNRRFFSLGRLNEAIRQYLEQLNDRPFQKLPGTRRQAYLSLDKPALKPLPPVRYEFAKWKKARVNVDYHVQIEKCYYSVPYQLARQQVDVRITATTVEVLHNGSRVASHPRSHVKGAYSTDASHRPASHNQRLEWPPSRIVNWAASVGPSTAQLVQAILDSKVHPEQGYRTCLGIISLARKYPLERIDAASVRALRFGVLTCKSLKSILDTGLDRQPLEQPEQLPLVSEHRNLRGASYYSREEVKTGAEPTGTLQTQEHEPGRNG